MPHVRFYDDLRPEDVSRFGGKAVHCALLHQAGFDVPPGIAIAFDRDDRPHLPDEVRAWLAEHRGARFAVRSSAPGEDGGGHSFAGVHESILDVTADDVGAAIEACVASMSSERAQLYRATRNIEAAVGAGVLVQRMIAPLRAGVAFTVDPVNGDDETIVINSAAGLGDAVVAGSAGADEQRIRRSERSPLVDVLLRIEALYGAPQDVEWCDDGQRIWIVQSRPITTPPVSNDIEWTRANLREVLPELVPHGVLMSLHFILMRANRAAFGAFASPALGPFLRVIRGRLYFNLTIMRHIARVTGQPEATILRSLGHAEEITAAEEAALRPRLGALLRAFPVLARMLAFHLRPRRTFDRALREVRSVRDRLDALPRATMSDEELRAAFRGWLEHAWRDMSLTLVLGGVTMLERTVAVTCAKRGIDFDALLQARLCSGERSVTSQQGFDLLELARTKRDRPHEFDAVWTRFLAAYGHRGVYETDWSRPRFAEDPAPLRSAIDAHLAAGEIPDPAEIKARQERAWELAWDDARCKLRPLERRRIRALLDRMKTMFVWREQFRSELIRVMVPLRAIHLELATRFIARGWLDSIDDAFLLTPDELRDVRAKAIARARRAQREAFAAMDAPLLLRASQRVELHAHDGDLRGLCVSRGVVEGVVAVLRDAHAPIARGAILVTVATDPSWTPFFTLAGGVITEIGGTLSHAATLARELGVPALANVRDATTRLRDGMRIRLDATAGTITIL